MFQNASVMIIESANALVYHSCISFAVVGRGAEQLLHLDDESYGVLIAKSEWNHGSNKDGFGNC
jgi:hypothetical protein